MTVAETTTGQPSQEQVEQHQHPQRHRVRVWFGAHVIAQYVADAPLAARYEQAMRRRFAGLRVTNDLVGPQQDVGH